MNQTNPSSLKVIWRSPISANDIASGSIKLAESRLERNGRNAYWVETRPREGGRNVVVRQVVSKLDTEFGQTQDMFGEGFNARTLVHEYGGGAYAILEGLEEDNAKYTPIAFVNYKDQRIYVTSQKGEPKSITKEGPWRYADLVFDKVRNRIICVMEIWSDNEKEPQNVLASISLSGTAEPEIIFQGHDFFAFPRLSDDGNLLAFIAWEHPNMPWDESRLYLSDLTRHGAAPVAVAGGVENSVYQPLFGPDGTLFFVAEDTGFWNIYRISHPERVLEMDYDAPKMPVLNMSAEFGLPLWVFADPIFDLASDGQSLFSAYCQKGLWHLSLLQYESERNDYDFRNIDTPFTDIDYLSTSGDNLLMIAGAPNMVRSVVLLDTSSGKFKTLRSSCDLKFDDGYVSIPQAIEFAGAYGETAHAFYYPPSNKDVESIRIVDLGEKPPLIVRSHGGPTAASDAVMNLTYQYWTSRGFAVVDVNYGGSTGFGRKYRNRLLAKWGVVDMLDCEAAARYLKDQKLVDESRLIIAGGSAGGYTTLCALTFTDTFTAGCSYYGIGDLKALMSDTHKFESRYLDSLIGPYPQAAELYTVRSPLNFTEKLNCPVIFFQGLEDKVVPPAQAEQMVEALRKKHLPVAYIAYEGEQHGFRKAENIKQTLESELYFYSLIFDLKLNEEIKPISVNF